MPIRRHKIDRGQSLQVDFGALITLENKGDLEVYLDSLGCPEALILLSPWKSVYVISWRGLGVRNIMKVLAC